MEEEGGGGRRRRTCCSRRCPAAASLGPLARSTASGRAGAPLARLPQGWGPELLRFLSNLYLNIRRSRGEVSEQFECVNAVRRRHLVP